MGFSITGISVENVLKPPAGTLALNFLYLVLGWSHSSCLLFWIHGWDVARLTVILETLLFYLQAEWMMAITNNLKDADYYCWLVKSKAQSSFPKWAGLKDGIEKVFGTVPKTCSKVFCASLLIQRHLNICAFAKPKYFKSWLWKERLHLRPLKLHFPYVSVSGLLRNCVV